MAVTEGDKFATQISGESTSGGPKIVKVDDDGRPYAILTVSAVGGVGTITRADIATEQISGESKSGGPKRFAVDDDGAIIGILEV